MPQTPMKGMAIAVGGYAAIALVAGALAGGGPRDRASASSSEVAGVTSNSATADRYPSLDALLYSRPDLATARSLLTVSGIVGKLDRSRQAHTLMIPVDLAFSDQQGVTDSLSRPSNSRLLKRTMRFHVVTGRRGLYAGSDLRTMSGDDKLAIRSDGRTWWAGDGRIIGGPLRFPRGVAYLVDSILVAPGQQVTLGP